MGNDTERPGTRNGYRAALETVANTIGFRSVRRYETRCRFLFDEVPLDGRRILEVGCGRGWLSLWTALHGASFVMGLEPEVDGSTGGTLATFRRMIADLDLGDRIVTHAVRLEEAPKPEEPFDLAILYNVINHLNETAVKRLHNDPSAVAVYQGLLADLRRFLAPGAIAIVADSGHKNLWPKLGWQSPWAKFIDWTVHQEPKVWIPLFRKAGFELVDLRWSPLYPFGRLSTNRLVHYLTMSHFVLRFRVPG